MIFCFVFDVSTSSTHDECCGATRRTKLVLNDFVFDLSMLLDRVRRICRSVVGRREVRFQVHFDVYAY